MNIFKKLFCEHNYEPIGGSKTLYAPSKYGNLYKRKVKCSKCGKVKTEFGI